MTNDANQRPQERETLMCDDALRHTLGQVYERSRRQLCIVASRYVGRDAEDVVQDAFVRALRFDRSFRGDAAPLTWLHRIVVNDSLNHYRRRDRWHTFLRRHIQPRFTQSSQENTLAIRLALRELTSHEYRVFVLYEVSGHSHNEIATLLSIPIGTSKWRLASARRRLQALLSDRMPCRNQFSVGIDASSMTSTSTAAVVGSSFSPSCSWTATKMEGRSSEAAGPPPRAAGA